MIGERRAAILGLITDYYIKTGEPLGSKNLCNMLPYPISSATIRNEMAYLTSVGFLEQRHTSGGRVPTKAAYRYYIDNLMPQHSLSPFEKQQINEVLSINASDPERLLSDAARLLSELTGCAAFYSTVKDPLDCVQGVQLIPSGGGKAMLVMLTVGGRIKSSVCKLSCTPDEEFLKAFYELTQKIIIGVPLSDINLSLIQSAAPLLGDRIFDMLPILSSLCSLCKEAGGLQDQIAAAFGGLNLIEFSADGYEVRPVIISPERKEQLNDNLVMFFTGFTRFSSDVQKANAVGKQDKTAQLREMLALVDDAECVLTDKNTDLDDFGRMLDHTWKLKRQTGSAVSTNSIDELYAKGMAAGALGGKLLGAGGGGFLVFYVQPDHQDAVRWAMRDLMYIPFEFEDGGTRVIYYSPETYESKN